MRRRAKPAKAKAKARLSVARKSPKSEASTRGQLEKRLAAALEQQAATSEVLKVISQSTFDLEPVLQSLVDYAARLCDADQGIIWRFDGEVFRAAAHHMVSSDLRVLLEQRPLRPGRGSGAGRAAIERRTVHIVDIFADSEYDRGDLRQAFGFRSLLAVPMIREGNLLGVFSLHRFEVGSFTDRQIELVTTFADQAVIAIESVRLFTELGARNTELTDTLDQQTATAEILRVISRSPTDVQPVLAAVATAARRFCGALDALVALREDDAFVVAAHDGPLATLLGVRRPIEGSVMGVPLADGRTFHVPSYDDLDPVAYAVSVPVARQFGIRSAVVAPMLRDGVAIGSIFLRRAKVGGFTSRQIELLETFAAQAVIAIENVRLFTELGERNRGLTVALDQQTATSEILRVISSSQTDVQPVFDAIVRNAMQLCDADQSYAARFDGEMLHPLAFSGFSAESLEMLQRMFPMRPRGDLVMGRAALTRAPANVPDTLADSNYSQTIAVSGGWRTTMAVPMLRDGNLIGVIAVGRVAPRAFPDQHIELLKTFAAQAVIAIENVRLFTELEARNRDLTDALEQQTATAEILGVISGSPTDTQPVFDTILRSAVRLSEARFGAIYRFDGEMVHLAGEVGSDRDALDTFRLEFPMRPDRGLLGARSILERAVVHVPDVFRDGEFRAKDLARMSGWSSAIAVPMLREGAPVGAIVITKAEPGPFSDVQIALLRTFADQAVIAIENVRLFKELEARNSDLTETLEQQTATAEILRAISSSPTDVQPVFDTIVRSAVRLCDGLFSALYRFDGELHHLAAHHNYTPEALEEVKRLFPAPATRSLFTGRAILERAVVHIPDVELDEEFGHPELYRAIGFRSGLFVPMLRDDVPIGVIVAARATPGPFSDNEIQLLKTFAAQAVIAVENVRLFRELQARTRDLTRSVDQLTALGEVSRAVSSTLEVETVLDTIVSRASQLAGSDGCAIFEYDEATQMFYLRAAYNYDPALVETLRAMPLRRGEGAMGRATESGEPIQVADIAQPGAYQSQLRDVLIGAGFRALLSVPLLREDQIIGSLSLNRSAPGEFSPEVIEVLKNFATQSALAIQNARLFRELADKSRQLEVASQHKSEFLANMSHELRTPLNAIIGFSEVLTERMFGELNEKQDEYLKDIHASGTHLLSLINDILDLSKIEAGRMELELTDFSLPAAIDSAVTLVRERATRRGITLRTVAAGVGEVRGDERKIRQVTLNLLSNAIKFTPEGGRIEVRTAAVDGAAEVSVSDTGVGIAPEDQAAVFEEFRQVGAGAAKHEGTGLGLALCRKFVELHGGSIRVESQVGAGSTFTFRIPIRRGE